MEMFIVVPGVPKAKQRPKFMRTNWGGKAYTPKETVQYEQWVKLCWAEQSKEKIPDDMLIEADIKLYFPIPESYSMKKKRCMAGAPHGKKPDADNCAKSVLDGLQGCAFSNDSKIYKIIVEKHYSTEARAEVKLTGIERYI